MHMKLQLLQLHLLFSHLKRPKSPSSRVRAETIIIEIVCFILMEKPTNSYTRKQNLQVTFDNWLIFSRFLFSRNINRLSNKNVHVINRLNNKQIFKKANINRLNMFIRNNKHKHSARTKVFFKYLNCQIKITNFLHQSCSQKFTSIKNPVSTKKKLAI